MSNTKKLKFSTANLIRLLFPKASTTTLSIRAHVALKPKCLKRIRNNDLRLPIDPAKHTPNPRIRQDFTIIIKRNKKIHIEPSPALLQSRSTGHWNYIQQSEKHPQCCESKLQQQSHQNPIKLNESKMNILGGDTTQCN